jgi:type IV pilus assembly protein PilE
MKKRSERILRSERGFTLVELGVALAIMAILTMIAYPTYKNIKNRAYEAEAWAIMQEIRVDVWTDYLENEKFPSNLVGNYDTDDWEFTGQRIGEDPNVEFKISATGRGTTLTLTLDKHGKAHKGS